MTHKRKASISQDEKTWGLLIHLSVFLGWIIPLATILAPLILWVVKKEESAFLNAIGKSVLNFQITAFILGIIGVFVYLAVFFISMGFLDWILIGIAGLVTVAYMIFYLVSIILGAIAANNGEVYKFRLCISFLK